MSLSRRSFLQASPAAVLAGGALASGTDCPAKPSASPNERPVFGYIGAGIRFHQVIPLAAAFGPCGAICDVDGDQLDAARGALGRVYAEKGLTHPEPFVCEDYRYLLDRSDIDAVVIAAPDHWHAKLAIEALRAGKHVYCEKPMTQTIEEGQKLLLAAGEAGRTLQVGTQQRSGKQFQAAAALLRSGRLGPTKRVTAVFDASHVSEALPVCAPPSRLNWNRWLGPAPYVPYRASPTLSDIYYGQDFPFSRCHVHFRWWYEYGGGKISDWGAHHIDIAMWALDKSDGSIGRFTIDPLRVEHPVDLIDGFPVQDDRFNTASGYHVRVAFADGIELDIVDRKNDLGIANGVLFEAEKGRYFVNRGKLTGKPVEELADNPLPPEAYASLGASVRPRGIEPESTHQRTTEHLGDFIACMKSGDTPLSDAASHHRHLTICHATNIALRLGRRLTYDPAVERFVDDDLANRFLARTPRAGFEF